MLQNEKCQNVMCSPPLTTHPVNDGQTSVRCVDVKAITRGIQLRVLECSIEFSQSWNALFIGALFNLVFGSSVFAFCHQIRMKSRSLPLNT